VDAPGIRTGRTPALLRRALVLTLAVGPALWFAGVARADSYAPVDAPGPALSVPVEKLRASVACSSDLSSSTHEPVLLVPGTGVAPDEEFWVQERAFADRGIPYCTVATPNFATADIQVSAEYVVHALRYMHAVTGRKVDMVGGSQGGGPEQRWPLRFWPDVRAIVDDSVELVPTNHGTAILHTACGADGGCANALCTGSCVPALWQQADNANLNAAMNSRQETFPGISYSVVYSTTDEFVQPDLSDSGTSSLHGGGGEVSNVAMQDICPGHFADHLQGASFDPVAFALTMDALDHPGPADPKRIEPSVCTQPTAPYTSPQESIPRILAVSTSIFADRFQNQPRVSAEPPLACYVFARCPVTATPTQQVRGERRAHRHAAHRRGHRHARHHRRAVHRARPRFAG
jgi:hypothetical protein